MLPCTREYQSLPSTLYNADYELVFSYPDTSNHILIRNKPFSNGNAGVYKIHCKDCNRDYYGETGRSCAVRLKEHMRNVKNCNLSNALCNHKIDLDHRIDWMVLRLILSLIHILNEELLSQHNNSIFHSGVCHPHSFLPVSLSYF